jgi:glutamyl-tRNA synthetase
MLKGHYQEGEAVVRLKTDMQHPNPAFRDRVLLRISERTHPRVGTKYRVWPLLEFSWAIDDHLLGMTHILRGKDLIIEDLMEKDIWQKLGWNAPEFIHYGMLRIKCSESKKQN